MCKKKRRFGFNFLQGRMLSSDVNVLQVCVDAHKHKRWDPSMLPAVQLST